MRSRNNGLQAGAIRLELLVMFLVVLVLVVFLLRAVAGIQAEVERTLVDAEVMSLRTELQLAAASAVNRGREAQLSGWVAANPLEVAGRTLDPGRIDGDGRLKMRQEWRWDAGKGELVYVFADGGRVQLRIARTNPAGKDAWGLGGGLVLIRERK